MRLMIILYNFTKTVTVYITIKPRETNMSNQVFVFCLFFFFSGSIMSATAVWAQSFSIILTFYPVVLTMNGLHFYTKSISIPIFFSIVHIHILFLLFRLFNDRWTFFLRESSSSCQRPFSHLFFAERNRTCGKWYDEMRSSITQMTIIRTFLLHSFPVIKNTREFDKSIIKTLDKMEMREEKTNKRDSEFYQRNE